MSDSAGAQSAQGARVNNPCRCTVLGVETETSDLSGVGTVREVPHAAICVSSAAKREPGAGRSRATARYDPLTPLSRSVEVKSKRVMR